MGRRGPRRKLAEINRLEGNPGRRLIEETGIEALGSPFIPEHLSDDARGCMDIIKQSMPSSVYSALDSFLLSAFAMAWAIHKRATHEIGAPGFQWTTASKRGSPQASPWIRTANQQAGIMAALGDRLGLDPKSRAALKLPITKSRSKFEGLIGPIDHNAPSRRGN
jgi:P27 family predicted phage terminase small subunit